jgi:sialate O-acetylesterase
MKRWPSLFALSILGCAADARAAIRLPRLVSDNMVLQRDAPLTVWGWAAPGERVSITFHGARVTAKTNRQGRWQASLPPQAAGGPFDMKLRGKNRLVVKNVLLGDVWLASGQSNMQFPLVRQGDFGGVSDAEREQRTANFPRIRLFQVTRGTALAPAADVTSTGWSAATPASVANFSAIAYLFGRELHQRYDVPIGLIDATWGGTPAETWISANSLQAFPDFAASAARAAAIPAGAAKDYDGYLKAKSQWYQLHGTDDRGRVDGRDVWAQPAFDDSHWPTIVEPQPWPRKAVENFDGTLWLRKAIAVPANRAGDTVRVHLGKLLQAETTYFNGHEVGRAKGEIAERDYEVPGEFVVAGRNVVAVRLEGQYQSGDGFVGMHGEAADMYVDVGGTPVPLAGVWSYQPGPDLSGLPKPPPLAEFRKSVPQAPTLLFNGMVSPLDPFRVKGVIWYQGETNVGRAVQYRTLFPTLIKDWRAAWGYDMPFLFVQLAGYGHDRPEPTESPWAELREAQAAALALPLTGMATAVDVGDENDVHPKNKQAVAHRLALSAAKVAYHQSIVAAGPSFRSMQIEDDKIRIRFTDIGGGLRLPKNADGLQGFAVAASTGDFVWAVASIDGDSVLVGNPSIREPVAVRYDWSNTPHGNLYNKEGLPALPFRTDQGP